MNPLLTTAEACQVLGLNHRSSLTRYVAEGRIEAVQKLSGSTGAYLFDADEIERFRAERDARASA